MPGSAYSRGPNRSTCEEKTKRGSFAPFETDGPQLKWVGSSITNLPADAKGSEGITGSKTGGAGKGNIAVTSATNNKTVSIERNLL